MFLIDPHISPVTPVPPPRNLHHFGSLLPQASQGVEAQDLPNFWTQRWHRRKITSSNLMRHLFRFQILHSKKLHPADTTCVLKFHSSRRDGGKNPQDLGIIRPPPQRCRLGRFFSWVLLSGLFVRFPSFQPGASPSATRCESPKVFVVVLQRQRKLFYAMQCNFGWSSVRVKIRPWKSILIG